MTQKLYIGNLPYRTTEGDLRLFFKKYGPIHSLILIADKATEQPRGYGFIELDEPKADIALSDLKDATFNGRSLKFSKATGGNPRQKKMQYDRYGVRRLERGKLRVSDYRRKTLSGGAD